MKVEIPTTMRLPPTPLEVRVKRRDKSGVIRSIVKTITYRIISAASTMTIAWFIFGSIEAAGLFGIIDLVANTVLYFTHERVWVWLDVRRRKET